MADSLVFITPPLTNKKLLTFDNYGSPENVSFIDMLSYIDKQIIKMYCDLQSTLSGYIDSKVTQKISEISSNIVIGQKILEAQVDIIDSYNTVFADKIGTTIKDSSPVSKTLTSAASISSAKKLAMDARASEMKASMDKSTPNALEYGKKITLRLENGGDIRYLQVNNFLFLGDFVQLNPPEVGEGNQLQWIISKA
jgi:hypothetical protein